jgi:predicted phosphodiesterase
MKINVLSDLHLGYSSWDTPINGSDLVVLAGDIAPPRLAIAWALRLQKPVVYVPGNHEFYGSSIEHTTAQLEALCAGTQVHVLDDDVAVIGGVRFVGTTLWTDFRACGDGEARSAAMEDAKRQLRDFNRIRLSKGSTRPFTPEDAAALFEHHATWLARQLAEPHDGPTVVVSHHAPSLRSIHPRFAGSLLNASFVSDVEHLLGADKACCWIHGHTHDSFDYTVRGTRVICNPRGYAKAGRNENRHFDPHLVIDVGPSADSARAG